MKNRSVKISKTMQELYDLQNSENLRRRNES
jgi:hypothetical protein